MDDLKLSVVIEALLNAKGFEDAKTAIKTAADTAKKAADQNAKTSDQTRKMGESFGGTRGPVADLTRILLQNVGATGAAGEAAKAAGTAMYFMEGAATATAVATSGIIAAIAFGLPLLIEWFKTTEKQAEEQHSLRDSLEATSDLINKLIQDVPQLSAKYREMAAVLHGASLDKQSDRLRELLNRQGELQKKIAASTSEWQKGNYDREINQLQAEVRLLMDAQEKNLTVTEMINAEREKHAPAVVKETKAIREKTEAVEKLTLAEKMAIEQEIDAIVDRVTLTQRQDKARAKAADDETQRILDRMALERADLAQAQAIAAEKASLVRQAAAVLTSAFAGLVAAFTKNKALNIAAATADTFAAANVALKSAPPPLNFALMAAVIAQGIANVHRIRTANPEGIGFDDPWADITARQFGRRSAKDFAREFGGQFYRSLQGEMMQQAGAVYHTTTINRGVTHNYGGIHGLLAGSPTAFARGLDRAMTRAGRFRRRTTQGR